MRDLADEFAMTGQTRMLCHAAIECRNANGFGKSAEGERAAVIEPIQGFDRVCGDERIVGRVTVVTGCHGVMRRAIPAVKLVSHNVTIGARIRVIHKVRITLGVGKGERRQGNRRAENNGDCQCDWKRGEKRQGAMPKRRKTIHTQCYQNVECTPLFYLICVVNQLKFGANFSDFVLELSPSRIDPITLTGGAA